jgi:hypothetical protein
LVLLGESGAQNANVPARVIGVEAPCYFTNGTELFAHLRSCHGALQRASAADRGAGMVCPVSLRIGASCGRDNFLSPLRFGLYGNM